MKSLQVSALAPFKERPWYENREIEIICSNALREAELYPSIPAPIRIERLLEKRFNLVPEFEDLKQYGVMGLTLFGKTGPQQILVDRGLEGGDETTKNRYVSTLAHEAGHCLLHSHLFALKARKNGNSFLCREEFGNKHYRGDWWEYQANMAIGALLIPEQLLRQYLKKERISNTAITGLATIAEIARIFQVSTAVARIRLQAIQ